MKYLNIFNNVNYFIEEDKINNLSVVLNDVGKGASGYGYGYGRSRPDPWSTHYERLEKRFGEVGRAVCGQPYSPPRIIFWNLRSGTRDQAARSDRRGVTLLSGFSQSLLTHFMDGSLFLSQEAKDAAAREKRDKVILQTSFGLKLCRGVSKELRQFIEVFAPMAEKTEEAEEARKEGFVLADP